MRERRWIGYVLVIVGAFFWGIGGTISQRLFQVDSIVVEWLVAVRLLLSGFLLLFFATFFHNQSLMKIWFNRRAVAQLFIFSVFGMLAVQYTYMASIEIGNAAVATMLQYLAPVFIVIYLFLTRTEVLRRSDLLAVATTVLGTFLLLTNGSFSAITVPFPAIIWGILSGIAVAFYTLFARQIMITWGSLTVIGWSMVIGGIVMSFIHPPWQVNMEHWTSTTFFLLLFVILFGTMIAFWFYLESLHYLAPHEASLLATLEPLTAIIASVLWLHIPFGSFQIIGTILILSVVLYISVLKKTA